MKLHINETQTFVGSLICNSNTMRNVAHANNELFNPLLYRCDMWSNAFNNFKVVQNFFKA